MRDSTSPVPEDLVPAGTWIRIDLAKGMEVLGFTYLDAQEGFSAQGPTIEDGVFDADVRTIVRSPSLFPWRRLDTSEIKFFGLEISPSWIDRYGPQPIAGTPWGTWRKHPRLKDLLLPDYPDDLQVLVHDGGPRIARNPPEAIWVRVVGDEAGLFRGRILNQPHKLQTIKYGEEIRFMVAEGADFPIMVTAKYLAERKSWEIHPCEGCGFSELFDAPSDLLQVIFPDAPKDSEVEMFTSFCPLCGGVQGVESIGDSSRTADKSDGESSPKRSSWRFWRKN
jgi:hypothetical protein